MLGWMIIVRAESAEDVERAGAKKEKILASWETSLGGTDWLEALCASGKAQQTRFDGYPLRFEACARDVLPLLHDGPPPYRPVPNGAAPSATGNEAAMGQTAATSGWTGKVQFHHERIKACVLDQRLTIDAWDQS